MAKLLKVRKDDTRTYDVAPEDDGWDSLIGRRYYLTTSENQSGYTCGKNRVLYHLEPNVPRTNRGIERERGWLGTTDNVYREALGRYEVVAQTTTTIHLERVHEA